MPKARKTARATGPRDLLAAIPSLCGFQPDSSIVAVGTGPSSAVVRVMLRFDLPDPPDARLAEATAREAAPALAANDVSRVVVVGYGPAALVTPVADALREHLPQAGIEVAEMLRVEGRRYWSYVCTDPVCCPPDGVPFDPDDRLPELDAHPVLASREELAASVAAVTGTDAESMRQALDHATRRRAQMPGRRRLWDAGVRAVDEAVARYRGDGRALGHTEAAWLAVALLDVRVRDHAWSRMDPQHTLANLRLWTDLTRLTTGTHVAAPASLLAFCAWQSGQGALANVAVDRALSADPRYHMARMMREVLANAVPPSLARLPMTPEELAAAYGA